MRAKPRVRKTRKELLLSNFPGRRARCAIDQGVQKEAVGSRAAVIIVITEAVRGNGLSIMGDLLLLGVREEGLGEAEWLLSGVRLPVRGVLHNTSLFAGLIFRPKKWVWKWACLAPSEDLHHYLLIPDPLQCRSLPIRL